MELLRPSDETPDKPTQGQIEEPPVEPNPTVEHSTRIPQNDEHRRRCRFWALNNLQPMVYQEFAKLDPNQMDDLDRILWRPKLYTHDNLGYYEDDHADGSNIPSLLPQDPGIYCRDYWAEPIGPDNADLRNHGFETQCRRRLEGNITEWYARLADAVSYAEDNETVYQIPNQYVRILQWLDISGEELLESDRPPYKILQEQSRYLYAHLEDPTPDENILADYRRETDTQLDLKWMGILKAAGMSSNSSDLTECHYYYSQAFYGYWIPFDPGAVPDYRGERDLDLPKYEPSTMPIYLPKNVDSQRIRAGYPLGQTAGRYYLCRSGGGTEDIGYYYVDHPAGNYCDKIR